MTPRAEEQPMNTVKIDQVADRLPDLIANLTPGEEIIIIEGEIALARVTVATKLDQSNLNRLAMAAAAVEEPIDDFVRHMT